MAGVRGGRERGSVFRRRRVRGVVLLSLVLVFTSVMPWGAVQIDWPLATGSCRSSQSLAKISTSALIDLASSRQAGASPERRRNAIKREWPRNRS